MRAFLIAVVVACLFLGTVNASRPTLAGRAHQRVQAEPTDSAQAAILVCHLGGDVGHTMCLSPEHAYQSVWSGTAGTSRPHLHIPPHKDRGALQPNLLPGQGAS